MDLTENIIDYFKSDKSKEEKSSPEGTCPLCWGYQEYDGKIRTLLKDKQIDVNNHVASYSIIQEFVKTNIDGIKLLDAEVRNCPTCEIEKKK